MAFKLKGRYSKSVTVTGCLRRTGSGGPPADCLKAGRPRDCLIVDRRTTQAGCPAAGRAALRAASASGAAALLGPGRSHGQSQA
jgi:hypothetical protein